MYRLRCELAKSSRTFDMGAVPRGLIGREGWGDLDVAKLICGGQSATLYIYIFLP